MKTLEVAVMLTVTCRDDVTQEEAEENVANLIQDTITDNDGSLEITDDRGSLVKITDVCGLELTENVQGDPVVLA